MLTQDKCHTLFQNLMKLITCMSMSMAIPHQKILHTALKAGLDKLKNLSQAVDHYVCKFKIQASTCY